ncbi:MAG: fumarylacetoacetate hydrolase family protein [Burkholderiales bacterium]
MSTETLVQSLWDHHARGEFLPPEWMGKLVMADGYRAQLGLLDRKVAGGARQVGWKVGLTAALMREMFRNPEPVFGHLLQSGRRDSGHAFIWSDLRKPAVESELLITLASDLQGPAVTVDDARRAIASVAPALEIVELGRADMRTDLALAVADNVAQHAFVHGAAVPLGDLDFGAVRAKVEVNGEVVAEVVGREVIDHQLQTLAWLAATLHRFGRGLRAGDCIMTGSFTRPLPMQPGDRVRTTFDVIGAVSASFA